MEDIIVKDLRTLEFEIDQLKKQTTQNIIEIGKRLIEAKNRVPHGEWENWLSTKAGLTKVTASRFMRVADEFPNVSTSTHLTVSKAFELLTLSPNERQDFIEKNNVEDISTRELREQVKKYKEQNARLLEDLDEALRENDGEPKVIEKEVVKEVIKEVIPDDYLKLKEIELLKTKTDIRNRELENQLNQKDKQITELKLAKAEVVEKLPSTKQKERIINDAWEFTRACESFLKEVGGLVYLTQSIADLPAQERAYYQRSIENVWAWANMTKFNLEKELSND